MTSNPQVELDQEYGEVDDVMSSRQARRSESTERVPVNAIIVSDSPRMAGENMDHIRMLAKLEAKLPPIVVHRRTMHVIDGAHRLRAAILRGDDLIEVKFFDGTDADAFVVAVEMNGEHGLPLSLADRTAAAARIVDSHPLWSDRRIAKVVSLAGSTVGAIRRRSTAQNEQLNTNVGSDGRVRPRNGGGGRQLAGDLIKRNPDSSMRAIAKAAGVSPATASDVRARLDRGEPPVTPRQRLAMQQEKTSYSATSQNRALSVVSPDIVSSLTKDPSLRFSDAGKILLRALGNCAVNPEQWARIVEAVPTHHQETVVRLARLCASMWQDFADRLAEQMDGTSPK